MTQTFPTLHVSRSPAPKQLILRYRTNTVTTLFDAFLAEFKLGTFPFAELTLYQEEDPPAENGHYLPGPAVDLRGLTYLSEDRWVDYASPDFYDFDTDTFITDREENRWMAELTAGYVDITVQVHEADWGDVQHLMETNSNVHLSVSRGVL